MYTTKAKKPQQAFGNQLIITCFTQSKVFSELKLEPSWIHIFSNALRSYIRGLRNMSSPFYIDWFGQSSVNTCSANERMCLSGRHTLSLAENRNDSPTKKKNSFPSAVHLTERKEKILFAVLNLTCHNVRRTWRNLTSSVWHCTCSYTRGCFHPVSSCITLPHVSVLRRFESVCLS